jgi:hypothetical protein
MRTDAVFERIAGNLDESQDFPSVNDFDCLRKLMTVYEENCGRFEDYSLKYVKYLVKECETLPVYSAIHESVAKIQNACSY